MTLQAFIDDSASDVDDRRFFMVGLVQRAEVWKQFSDAWARVLAESPAIDYFHMVEAENLRDEFAGWDEAQRDQKIEKLTKIIMDCDPWWIECSISRYSFSRILKPYCPYDLKDPYFWCFYGLVVNLARMHSEKSITIPVDFTFDNHPSGQNAVFWYETIKQELPRYEWISVMGGPPILRDDKLVLPLQAADLLAWHVRRRSESRNLYEHRPTLADNLNRLLHAKVTFNNAQLVHFAERFKKVPGIHETVRKKDSVRKYIWPKIQAKLQEKTRVQNRNRTIVLGVVVIICLLVLVFFWLIGEITL